MPYFTPATVNRPGDHLSPPHKTHLVGETVTDTLYVFNVALKTDIKTAWTLLFLILLFIYIMLTNSHSTAILSHNSNIHPSMDGWM